MKLLFAVVLIASIGLAQAAYVNDEAFGLGNGAYITVNQTTFDNLTCCDNNTLSMGINGSFLNLTAGTNKTITNPSYVSDIFTIPLSGTSGYFNFSVKMINASNSYNLSDGSFVESKNTSASGYVWFNYSFTTTKTLVVSWNGSSGGDEVVNSTPNIIAYYNSINGWNQTAMSINAGNSATFNITVNQTITNVSWKVAGGEEQNTSSLEFTRYFGTVGDFNVTTQAFNVNGSSNIIHTVVTVTTTGGGGTDWDWVYGYVKWDNGTAVNSATVATSAGNAYTDAYGYYLFDYLFEHGQTYNFNISKSGIWDNKSVTFTSGDYEVVNGTLASPPPPPPPPPPSSSVYNVHYEYGCGSPTGNITPSINIVYGMIILVIIIVLFIVIVGVIQENPMMGLVISGILIVSSGAIFPSIVQFVYEAPLNVPGCTNYNEAINVSGQQDMWLSLVHAPIRSGSQVVSNASYVGVNNTDYLMNYSAGLIKPLSTGGLYFGS